MLPSSAKKNQEFIRYVNNMLNICYLTGFVRTPGDGMFLLQQNNNLEQAIPIQMGAHKAPLKEFTPVTVLGHVYGELNDEGESNVVIRAIDIQKPSIRALPPMTAWNMKKQKGTKIDNSDDFRPFTVRNGKPAIREDLLDGAVDLDGNFSPDEQILRDILEATQGRLTTKLGDNANVVLLAGFVDSMALIAGNEHQENSRQYGMLMLRQHADPAKNLPIRIHAHGVKGVMKALSVAVPVSVSGQIRMKIIPNDDGTIKSRNLHVRVSDVFNAGMGKEIKSVPDFWGSMRDRLLATRRERAERAEQRRQQTLPEGVTGVVADL